MLSRWMYTYIGIYVKPVYMLSRRMYTYNGIYVDCNYNYMYDYDYNYSSSYHGNGYDYSVHPHQLSRTHSAQGPSPLCPPRRELPAPLCPDGSLSLRGCGQLGRFPSALSAAIFPGGEAPRSRQRLHELRGRRVTGGGLHGGGGEQMAVRHAGLGTGGLNC